MNEYHKKLESNKNRIGNQQAVRLCNKAINDYSIGYDIADRDGDNESRSYFEWRIKQVCQLVDEILY